MYIISMFLYKTYCCYDNKSDKFKFSSKGLIKRVLKVLELSLWQSMGSFSMKQLILHLPTEKSELQIIWLLHTNRQGKDLVIFIQ